MGAAPVKPSMQRNTSNYDMLVEKMESSVDNAEVEPSDHSLTEVRYIHFCTYGIIGEGSLILTNQNRESTVSSLMIGLSLGPFSMIINTVLH